MSIQIDHLSALQSADLSTTLEELEQFVLAHEGARTITLGEIFFTEQNEPAPKKRKKKAPPKPGVDAFNLRTEEGRAALDAATLSAVKKHGPEVGSEAFKHELSGVTGPQLRASLNRLIEAGSVTFTGKARGTKYTAV